MREPDIVRGDKLSETIWKLTDLYRPQTILEIGSSDGRGSTKMIIEALIDKAKLFCIELLDERFELLIDNVSKYDFVYPYKCSSVSGDEMMPREYIDAFKSAHPDFRLWEMMPMQEIYLWHSNSVKHATKAAIPNGIDYIKKVHHIENFDMVLIDGSPFSGMAELKKVYGSDVIILDDTIDIKCYDAMQLLLNDHNYICIFRDDTYRNGYAVFKWKI